MHSHGRIRLEQLLAAGVEGRHGGLGEEDLR
jgi:hypothetical protein